MRGPAPAPAHRAFAAFANRDFRIYVLGGTAAMMADNIEHVISYKVMFDRFHSPALAVSRSSRIGCHTSFWPDSPELSPIASTSAGSSRSECCCSSAYRSAGESCSPTDTVNLGAAMLLLDRSRPRRCDLDAGCAGADSPDRRARSIAERGAPQRHRPVPRLSRGAAARRGALARARPGTRHFRQCPDLHAAVDLAHHRALTVPRPRSRGQFGPQSAVSPT